MERRLALIGFGEAAAAFAPGLTAYLSSYDPKIFDPAHGDTQRVNMEQAGAIVASTPADALAQADAALSLVTADQSLAAARTTAGLSPGAFWFDMNSVAPATKAESAVAIEQAGGRYVDVAVMAPVHPARLGVPLLVSGPHAMAGAALLRELGFAHVETLSAPVGAASAVKMIRSIMVKGIEALSAECARAAHAAGVLDTVVASLDRSWPGADWAQRFDYNLERMLRHGERRAAELTEVVATLDALGTPSEMSRATIDWQRRLGAIGTPVPDELRVKLDRLAADAGEGFA
ncbi:DUF1932 domain-containing protein [Sphingomonas donggukensis]|uniref:DUF1932 domain-containing protein n=1 Tax=Sphingomonas donggukensis TaxID=2949093 RepID=A0ABY4TRR8_9SPHN|nr:NAD(P)-dependent oxidoreductase [Sphingomonas donggukensis]URW75092.1 DUF1932 domain-containing protein [Sphingomonas donggukensis]